MRELQSVLIFIEKTIKTGFYEKTEKTANPGLTFRFSR